MLKETLATPMIREAPAETEDPANDAIFHCFVSQDNWAVMKLLTHTNMAKSLVFSFCRSSRAKYKPHLAAAKQCDEGISCRVGRRRTASSNGSKPK